MTLGDVIKRYRIDRGLSQRDFAKACELSTPYISQLENNKNPKTGEPPIPSLETFMKVADGMRMDVLVLLDIVDENKPPLIEYYTKEGRKEKTFLIEAFMELNSPDEKEVVHDSRLNRLRYYANQLSDNDLDMITDMAARLAEKRND